MEEAQQQKEIERIYQDMFRHTEDEINRFYGKYASAEGIDIAEAKRRITQADVDAYEQLAKEYVEKAEAYRKRYGKNGGVAFSERAKQEMRLYNATMKINRLEMLKARIGVHLVAGINDIDQYYEGVITDRTRQEIERQAGILGETVSVADATKRANNIVNASFFNATYSERIWSHQDRLRSMISIELQRGLIAGVGSREMAQRIKREFDVSMSDAHRLMVTELRRVQTDVAMDSYKQSGVTRYVYMAVNPRACPICQSLNGKDYPVEGAEIANEEHPLPPMHPRCHCTTAPYVDEDDYNAWLEWLNKGGSTSEWNNMSPAERQKWLNPVVQSEPKTADTFTPAKTKAEAEEFARQFADNVDYSGVSLGNANIINKQLSVLTSKYPINKLANIQSGGKGVMNANYQHLGFNGKKLGKTLADEALNFDLNKAMNKASIRMMEERWAGKKMPFRIESDIEKLKNKIKFERWGVHSMYDDHLKCVVTHEYGHILSDQYFGMINNERANPNYQWQNKLWYMNERWKDALKKARETGDIYKISEYANTKPSEFFAECFALREMGGTLPDYIESLMVEVLSNGIM